MSSILLSSIVLLQIYPSDFGLARMKEEETHGPVELVTGTKDEYDEGDFC